MIANKLNIFSQNVHKNSLIINSILKTHNHFDISLIQEPPWSAIRSIPSSASSEEEVLVGVMRHLNTNNFYSIFFYFSDFTFRFFYFIFF